MTLPRVPARRRSGLLDLWRSLAVWIMLLYHLLYDLAEAGYLPASLCTAPWAEGLRTAGAGSFILIAGISVRLSRNPLRRAVKALSGAAAVTAASLMLDKPILFGALHLLGCCILFYALAGEIVERTLGPQSAPLLILLFLSGGAILPRLRVPVPFLFPLGLIPPGFVSWDYFPLLPWGFLFLFGICLGQAAEKKNLPEPALPPALGFCGRHSLAIYFLHQPIFYALLFFLKICK